MKKIFSFALVLLMITVSLAEPFTTTTYATQSRAENFSKSYSITGDAATDMVNIAYAQVGKRRSDIGYSEAWCADFVCDCAALAGQSNAIPFDGVVANLYNKVISAGGYTVSSPQAGDLAFYYCTSAYKWVHVAIMTGSEYSIQGNVNGSVMNIKSWAYWDAYGQTCYNITYVHPNYTSLGPASNPTIKISQDWYSVNDTISITAKADNAIYYFFAIYKDDTRIWEGNIESGILQYPASQFGEGHFSAYCSCYNSLGAAGSVDTSWVRFDVFGNPEYSSIYSTKQHYDLGEPVEIVVDTMGTGWQVIGINRLDDTREVFLKREITEEASADCVIDSNRLGPGQYNAYFSLYNTYGTIDTTLVFFEIGTHAEVEDDAVASTCTTEGLTKGKHCSVCGMVLEKQQVAAALGHSFGEWSVTKQASCTENGTESRTCASCGITEDKTIDAAGHTAGNWITVNESTCTQNGMKEQKCTECGVTVKSEAIPAKGHNYISTEIPATPVSQGYTLHECKECGDSYKDNYTDYVDPNAAKAVIETKTAAPGDTVTVSITLENAPALKTLAIRDIVYDASKLELIGGKLNAEGAIIADWNQADKNAVLAFGQNTDVNGTVFTLTFKVLEETEDAEVAISCKLTAREKPENGEETEVDISTVSGVVKISAIKRGDVNGDGYVDSDDAIHMLRFIMMPDGYPINQNGDFNGDVRVDSDDAIYLLYHVLLPDRYLLK